MSKCPARQRVLVTRPEQQAEQLRADLEQLGFDVLFQPAIQVLPPAHWNAVDHVIQRVTDFDWLVFFSVNGVEFFCNRVREVLGEKSSAFFPPLRIAVTGSVTEEALLRCTGRPADLVPNIFTADALAEALLEEIRSGPSGNGQNILVLRADRGRDVFQKRLAEANVSVTEIAVYRNVDVETPNPEIAEALCAGQIDFVTVTSSAIARSLVRMFGETLHRTKLVSISPITSQTLAQAGFPPQFEAQEASPSGIVDVLRDVWTLQ